MPVHVLRDGARFPDPSRAQPDGLLAVGRDLSTARLMDAYSRGIFPWYAEESVLWFSPDPRMVLLPADLHVSRSLRRTLAKKTYRISADTAFAEVIRACASVSRPGQAGTWISPKMIDVYCMLHAEGYAHSVEAWHAGALAGGLYGVSLGGAFFGESMFARRNDASKAAFVMLVRRLAAWCFDFVDCQVYTGHLARFGGVQWPRVKYLHALAQSLRRKTRRGKWSLEDVAS